MERPSKEKLYSRATGRVYFDADWSWKVAVLPATGRNEEWSCCGRFPSYRPDSGTLLEIRG